MNRRAPVPFFLLSLGLTLFLACESNQMAGTAGNACYENGTCNAGLTCMSGVCVKQAVQEMGARDATTVADAPKHDAAVNLVTLEVTPPTRSIARGTTQQFSATGTYGNSQKKDLTGSVMWSSSNTKVATISATGLASSVAPGSTTITARWGKISGSTTLTVTAATLVSIGVTPANPSIAKGSTQQLAATGIFTDSSKQDLTGSVMWSSSNTKVATISAAGLATAAGPGSTTITAGWGKISGSTTLTMTAATLESMEVTPAKPSIAKGSTQQFIATGIFTDSSKQDLTGSVTWSSSNPKVATISNAPGSSGLATATSAGTTTISGTSGSISGSASLTVTPAKLTSIAVTPAGGSVARGLTVQFTATGVYSDNSKQDLTAGVIWSSSNTLAATISSASGAPGLATTKDLGTTTISATFGSISGSTTLVVTAARLKSLAVSPAKASIVRGTVQQFTVLGTYTDNTKQNLTGSAIWSSSSSKVATVSNASGSAGLATGAGAGAATITAHSGTVSGKASLTVTPAVLVSLAVTPPNPSVAKGLTRQLAAVGTYSDNSTQELTKKVTWSSSDKLVATISNASGSEGLATSMDLGFATITATTGSVSGITTLTVSLVKLVSVEVNPAGPSVAKGLTRQLTAIGKYSDNTAQNLTAGVSWFSSDAKVATISNSVGSEGLATGQQVGSAKISATSGSISGSASLSVTAPELYAITITPASPSVAFGSSLQLVATGLLSDKSKPDLTKSVTWSSSNPKVATISNIPGSAGLVASVKRGQTTITAKKGTIWSSATLAAEARWTVVAAGGHHNCGVMTDGTLWCWGLNWYGQCGGGTTNNRTSPTQVGTLKSWASITAGLDFSCGVKTDKTLWCWGTNVHGQLGDGTTKNRSAPVQVGNLKNWAYVSSGYYHGCGVLTDGTLWCWGRNEYGQLGDGTTKNRHSPVQVGNLKGWASVAAGSHHTCGVRADKTLWCWGYNGYGQLGDGTTKTRKAPVQVGKLKIWAAVASWYFHGCGVRIDGTLWCWGGNNSGQLGDGTTVSRTSPVQVGSLKTWTMATAGMNYTCGARTDKTLWCWGGNWFGGLGDGTTSSSSTPVQVGSLATWASVMAGHLHTCAVGSDKALRCWGYNHAGQLGDGTTTNRTSPVLVP